MQRVSSRPTRVAPTDGGSNGFTVPADYPTRMSLYLQPPAVEVVIEDFETWALNRLRVLKTIENCKLRNKKDEELRASLDAVCLSCLPMHSNSSRKATLEEERKRDRVSHYVLRMAYCRREDLQKWFVTHEAALFKYRWETETAADRIEFLRENGVQFQQISPEEKSKFHSELAYFGSDVEKETFFKVPFEDAIDLIRRRAVFVRDGNAYVHSSELISLVLNIFKEKLARSLKEMSRLLPRMDEDDRLIPILENMSKQYLGKDYSNVSSDGSALRAEEIDREAKNFPLCMQSLHRTLREDSHLKHFGRLQYGLFLKGIGLPLEEALAFWKNAFCNKISEEKFQKEHAYNLRHNYGQEGKRKDYTPYSCQRIIQQTLNNGDRHGCPYRHFGQESLKALLHRSLSDTIGNSDAAGNIPSAVREISSLAAEGHCQIACTRHLEVSRRMNAGSAETITHPNMFYEMAKSQEKPSTATDSKQQATMDVKLSSREM